MAEQNCDNEKVDPKERICKNTGTTTHKCVLLPSHVMNVSRHWCRACNFSWNAS